jgi:hypothetical protein
MKAQPELSGVVDAGRLKPAAECVLEMEGRLADRENYA